MAYNPEHIHARYAEMQNSELNWKKLSDELFTPEDALVTWKLLHTAHLLPSFDAPLWAVFPSANSATHEAHIFEWERSMRTGPTDFYVGDFASIRPCEKAEALTKEYSQTSSFFFKRMDARIIHAPEQSLDVIGDRKGAMWHIFDGGTEKQVKDLIDGYHSRLLQGGIVVTDAMAKVPVVESVPDKKLIKVLNELRARGIIIDQLEQSTWNKLLQREDSEEILRYIQERFTFHHLGTGKYQIVALQKKLK